MAPLQFKLYVKRNQVKITTSTEFVINLMEGSITLLV